MFQCAFLFSAFLDFSTREKISGHSLVFISTHTYCSDAGRFLLKCAQILPHGFDLETVARLCRVVFFSRAKLQSGSRLFETAHSRRSVLTSTPSSSERSLSRSACPTSG